MASRNLVEHVLFSVPFERWCRLRGNLLIYFKSREAWSEPAGVIILEIGSIQVDPTAIDGLWGFTLGNKIQTTQL